MAPLQSCDLLAAAPLSGCVAYQYHVQICDLLAAARAFQELYGLHQLGNPAWDVLFGTIMPEVSHTASSQWQAVLLAFSSRRAGCSPPDQA